MARVTSEAESLTSQLVENLTGFQEGHATHKACMQFALSNLKFHRFLDVDSLKVTRKIKGLCEKFSVHSRDMKAQRLSELFDSFLSCPLEHSDPHSDVHYAVVLLMILLGESPTQSEYEEEEKIVEESVEDKVNWQEELHHDVRNWTLFDHPDNGEEWSDSEESDVVSDAVSAIHLMSDKENEKIEQKRTKHVNIANQGEEKAREISDYSCSQLMPQYWNSDAVSCHGRMTCHRNALPNHVVLPVVTCQTVTEYIIVRETIWLLSGIRLLHIYEVSADDTVSLKTGIQLNHLSSGCLLSCLSPFLLAGSSVMKINSVVSQYSGCGHMMTLQALSAALSDYMNMFHVELARIEKTILEGKGCLTISLLQSELYTHLKELRYVESVVSHCLSFDGSNAKKCCHVISTLFNTLADCDMLQDLETSHVGVILSLFLATIRPYLCIVDSWMLHGDLPDSHQEFFICRATDKRLSPHTQQYWKNAFVLQLMNGDCTTVGTENSQDVLVWLPEFLVDLKCQILLCGKSVELMHHVDQLHRRLKAIVCAVSEPSLHNGLTSALQANEPSTEGSSACIGEIMAHEKPEVANKSFKSLISLNFDIIFSPIPIQPVGRTSNGFDASFTSRRTFSLFSMRVRETLKNLIIDRHKQVCGTFLEWFMTDCHLKTYFTDIRHFFLMEEGHTMHHFCARLFNMVKQGERWKDLPMLNTLFQNCLGDGNKQVANRVFFCLEVSLEEDKQRCVPIHELDLLRLSLVVPWPASIVINDETILLCNKIFIFLLQIKRAKWSLEQIIWRGVCGFDQAVLHKLQLLQAKLLHFVNTLHMYVMTRILHSTSIEFDEAISTANDVDDLIDIHRQYINKVHDRCLLNEKASYVKSAIRKCLNLALIFTSNLERGVQFTRVETADRIERDYEQCNKFLVSFLLSLVRRGSYPHLEYLVVALQS